MDQFNFHDKDGTWPQHREFEVHLTTFDGTQHLRLNGWLKRNDVLVKSEGIHNHKGADTFGSFIIYINDTMLEKLKEENLERGLFCDIEVLNTEKDRWDTYKGLPKNEKLFEKIQDFMFSFQIQDKEDIDKYITEANEASLKLFKEGKSFIRDYVEAKELSYSDKLKDLDLLIRYFEEQERYEDCALILKIKRKVEKRNILTKIQGNE